MENLPDQKEIFLKQALDAIHFYYGKVPCEALALLSVRRQEALPYLLQELQNAILRADKTGNYYIGHIISLLLLAQFKEKKAYPLVIQLLRLPIEQVERLLGDMLMESIPGIIVSTYDGNVAPLLTLLSDQNVHLVIRFIMGRTLTALLYGKLIEQANLILELQKIVASGEKNEDADFFTVLANLTLDAKLEPLYDIVRAAFRANLIKQNYIDFNFFNNNLAKPINTLIDPEKLLPINEAALELLKWDEYRLNTSITPQIDLDGPCPCGSGKKFQICCLERLQELS